MGLLPDVRRQWRYDGSRKSGARWQLGKLYDAKLLKGWGPNNECIMMLAYSIFCNVNLSIFVSIPLLSNVVA